jgi:subtilisin family serine protease
MRFRTALLVGALALGIFVLPGSAALSADSTQTYIVQMLPNPVVTYAGGISGLPATKPGKGKKIDPSSSDVTKYADYLKGKHDQALSHVGGGQKLYDYVYSLNGFAAKLTEDQATRLSAQKNVLAVSPDEIQTIQTSTTPHFLGLDVKGGLWDQLGGVSKGGLNKGAGEDEVIGVIDSGVWPESQSFSDRKLDGSSGNNYPHKVTGFSGACQTGEQWSASNCNNKLISARYFNAAQGGNEGINEDLPWEFTSPRDYNGHGTHTSSTAGGNFGVQPTGDAAAAGFTAISGMAPRARIAAYKALWSSQDGSAASGSIADIVQAIDQAVADGVDVINYSVGPSTPPPNFISPEQVSFLNAAAAGIFVSAAAGNEGPGAGTVKNPGPWITTVAAGTHNRASLGSVTLGNNTTINGASSGKAVGPAPFVEAKAVGVAGANATRLAQCYSADANAGTAVLDPAKVAGKIVLCDRGGNARTDKSLAVKNAGGIGMVLVNTSPNSLNADIHFVPTVHVDDTHFTELHTYAATAGATAKINQSQTVFNAPAPQIAAFSSRGPQVAGAGDLLKPDVMAPGVDVLAAVSPAADHGRLFDLLSGTSMATPHVAGVAALLKQLHPDWSPVAVKSALMTSAYDMVDAAGNTANSSDPAVIFAEGAGHIKPNSAADPGLVFDSNVFDWLAFLCGTKDITDSKFCGPPSAGGVGTIDPSDLNMASIAIGDLAGKQTVTRSVTNVGSKTATYNASVSAPAGVTVDVSPSSLTIAQGETKSFTVTLTRTTAALTTYVGGHLTWSDGTHNARLPLVVRPVALAAPAEVTFNTAAGPVSWDVKTGYEGILNATVRGLVAANTHAWTVAQDPDQSWTGCGDTQGTALVPVTVPAGATIARIGIYEDAIAPQGNDLDLFICSGNSLVGVSADGDSNEEVTFTFAAPRTTPLTLTAYVNGFAVVNGNNGGTASGTLFDWSVPATDAGNTTLAITPAGNTTIGGTKTITATFAGLAAVTRYMGAVDYNNGSPIGRTIVRVNTP